MNCTALPSSPNDGWSNVPLPGLRNAGGYGKTASANCTPANSSSSLLSLLCCSEDTEQVLRTRTLEKIEKKYVKGAPGAGLVLQKELLKDGIEAPLDLCKEHAEMDSDIEK